MEPSTDRDTKMPQEGWPSGVGSRVQAHGPLFESWRVPCGGGIFMACIAPTLWLSWGARVRFVASLYSSYGSIQYSLAEGAPIRSRPGG